MLLKLALLAVALCVAAVSATPLDDYINKPDANFKYVDTGVVINGLDYDGYVYNMTSQEWLTPEITTRSVWWHWVVIVVPHNVKNYTKGVLWITGGTNDMGMPKALDSDLVILSSICVGTGTIGAALWQVPNAPIGFYADPWHEMHRVEDAAVAITWYLFAQQPTKPELLIYLPMTKAAVRALDMLGEVAPKYLPAGSQPIKEFIVSGASKRGWTTWLTGAVDTRVVGIIPIVLDALNLHAFIHRQLTYYGRFTFVMQDYVHANITSFMDTPIFTKMCSIIDPYYYLHRLTMPKFAINALGDEFQMPDDQRFWVKDAPGIMQTLMVKNAEHAMITGIPEAIPAATAFASALLETQAVAETMPTFKWWIDNGTGTIHVVGSQEFGTINVAWADSADGVSAGRRDFRWAALNVSFCPIKIFGGCIRPIIWQTTKKYLTQHNSTYWSATMPLPGDGNWRAFIVEFKFANKWGSDNFWYSTPASVIPDTAPFPPCVGEQCPTVMC